MEKQNEQGTEKGCSQGLKQILVLHNATTSLNRRTTYEGRDYLVSPVVALIEGIVNGEYVSGEELQKYVESWNGIPLPIGHPTSHGVPVSANCPRILEKTCIGRFFNANCDGKKLRGELWIDIMKAKDMGGEALEILNRLEQGTPLEVSTAYFRDLIPEPGTINGEAYSGTQINLRPDHLALLPHEIGACSWEDGCGGPRVNEEANRIKANHLEKEKEKRGIIMDKVKKKMMVDFMANADEVSHDEASALLEQALADSYNGDGMAFIIRERYDTFIIYQEFDNAIGEYKGPYYKRDYTIDADHVVTFGDPVEVTQVVEYVPVANPTGGAGAGAGEGAAEGAGVGVPAVPADNAGTVPAVNTDVRKGAKPMPAQNKKEPVSYDEWVAAIPDAEIREEMMTNRRKLIARKAELVKSLSANTKCAFDKAELTEMTMGQLEKLEKSMQVEDYSARGGPRSNAAEPEDEDAIPAPPSLLFAKKEKKE